MTDTNGPPDRSWYGRMETKLDMVLVQGADHEKRLRKLEQARNWIVGVMAAGGTAVGTTFAVFKQKVGL